LAILTLTITRLTPLLKQSLFVNPWSSNTVSVKASILYSTRSPLITSQSLLPPASASASSPLPKKLLPTTGTSSLLRQLRLYNSRRTGCSTMWYLATLTI
ncbi:hypothetical protein K469DRAFT_776714, partial [Zopfia rhizophila CBS 207.26]